MPNRIAIRFAEDPAEVMTFAEFAELNPREAELMEELEPGEGYRYSIPGEGFAFAGGPRVVVSILVLA